MPVNTARENFKGYTRHNIKRAREAQHIQGLITNPIGSLPGWRVKDF